MFFQNGLKLIDFSISVQLAPGTICRRSFTGTPGYCSPETLKRSFDAKADIWSVGCLTFELLFGYLPFEGSFAGYPESSFAMTLEGFQTVSKPFRGNWFPENIICSDLAKNFICELLEYNPLKRPDCGQCLAHDWLQNGTQ
jgi:serine/threonine protein kinase